jgi:hypothetical protein
VELLESLKINPVVKLQYLRWTALLPVLALALLSGCVTAPPAATPTVVSVIDGNNNTITPTSQGEYKALTLFNNVYTVQVTFQVPTLTNYQVYVTPPQGSQAQIYEVTNYATDSLTANYLYKAITLFRPLPTTLVGSNNQESLIITFPQSPVPAPPPGNTLNHDQLPSGTFPFPGTPLSVDVVDVSTNSAYTGTQKQSTPLTIPLLLEQSGGTGTGTGGTGSPSITSPLSETATVGQLFSYSITASNSPSSFAATGLPNGLSVDTSTGAIRGTPTVAGTDVIQISATNSTGTGTAHLTLVVHAATPPPSGRVTGAFKQVQFSPGSTLASHSGGFEATYAANAPGYVTPIVSYTLNGQHIAGANPVTAPAVVAAGALPFGLAFTSDWASGTGYNPNFEFGIVCTGLDVGIASPYTNEIKLEQLKGDASHQVNTSDVFTINVAPTAASQPGVYCSPDGTIAAVVSASSSSSNIPQVAIFDLLNASDATGMVALLTSFTSSFSIQSIELTSATEVQVTYSVDGHAQPVKTIAVSLVQP